MNSSDSFQATSPTRLKGTRYLVNWRSRVMTPDRRVAEGKIKEILKTGVVIHFDRALSCGSNANIEFYVNFRNEKVRVRAKTVVVYSMLRANSEGAELELAITDISRIERHTLNNILQEFQNAEEFSLKKDDVDEEE